MSVKAKFKVDSINRIQTHVYDGNGGYKPGEMQTIVLSPVYGNGDPNHENTKFWQASPSGRIELGCVNLEAAKQFELGKEYYLTFDPAN